MSDPIARDLMYRLLVQGVKDYAIYMLDGDGVVLNWNAGARRAKGYTEEEIVGRNFEVFYLDEERSRNVPALNLQRALKDGAFTTEGWRLRKDGSTFWASVSLEPIHDEAGQFLGFAKITRDLTEIRKLNRQIAHDSLTDLLNRSAFVDGLEDRLPLIWYGSAIAVHYIDLDRFKPVNDSFGHAAGDLVLMEVARRIRAVIGRDATLGRLGGDEFAIVQVLTAGTNSAEALAARVIKTLREPITVGTHSAVIGASIGIALAPLHGDDSTTLLRNADLALYEAKASGRNCFRVFEASMNEAVLRRSVLEAKLRSAIAAFDFHLHYQPVVEVQSRRTIGFEALLRWRDQTGQDVSPACFVPIAEDLGLMPVLGEWVLRQACTDAAQWRSDLVVAVNVSALQLRDTNFVEIVRRVLEETGLAPHRLELEITETAILADMETARTILTDLRQLGVQIALDDFGTGFSSLSMVKALPLTRIKIDRSFVQEIDETVRSTAIIRSIVSLCDGFGLDTTAEGVETEEQFQAIRGSGCVNVQGYLTGRPEAKDAWRDRTASAPPRLHLRMVR